MSDFDFITDEEFRASLESDYREMLTCIDAKAWKAAHVLSGGIIEAILLDYIIGEGLKSREDALKLDLANAIELCKKKDVISSKTADLSSAIKEYRNLIHPGRIIRLNENVDENTSNVARSLVLIIIGEITKKKQENYGYTAEQIASKLARDSSANAIVSHILKSTKQAELERLMLNVLPLQYNALSHEEFPPEHVFSSFELCFTTAFGFADETLKKKVVEFFVKIIKEEDDFIVFGYGTDFFRAYYLRYISQEERSLVKHHLLSRFSKSSEDEKILKALEGMGSFLDTEDITEFVDILVKIINSQQSNILKKLAEKVLEAETFNMKLEYNSVVTKRLNDWIKHYNVLGHVNAALKTEAIKIRLDIEDIELPPDF